MDDDDEVKDDEIEEREPQVTSDDPNERKLARTLRIERRLEAIRRLNMPEGEEEEEVIEKTLLQQQLQKTLELLEKLTIEGNEFVTNVRVANDSREVDRREEEGIGREKIIEQLQEEAADAEEQFDEIANKWLSILDNNDPLHINDEVAVQKEKCDELIKQKDEIIVMLRKQIRTAEIKFAKDQRKQNEDIETLARRIETQVTLMRRAYRQELELIEDVIMIERKILIDANDKKWDELYKKRDQEEAMNSNKKIEQLEEFEQVCTNLRVQHQEKYREIKIKLENEIENLQQELEQLKTLALINSEKLDYNYQILKKREDENIIIKSQQKRRINKYQDAINTLRRKINTYMEYVKNETQHLTADIHKLQYNVLDIEAKADHFTRINDIKYKQVWELNKKRAARVLNQILTTDRILHEQQLGMKWVDPENTLLEKHDLPSYKSALEIVQELYKKDEESTGTTKDKTTKGSSVEKEKDKISSLIPEGETMAHRRILRLILKLVADKSGFLIETRLKDILQPYEEHERAVIKVDSVFSALGIKRKEEVEVLLDFFLPYTHCPVCMGVTVMSIESSEVEIMSQTLNVEEQVSATGSIKLESEPSTDSSEPADMLSAIHQPNELIDEIVSNLIEYTPSAVGQPPMPIPVPEHVPEEEARIKPSNVTIKEPDTPMLGISEAKIQRLSTESYISKASCQNRHPLVISSVYILRALREFVNKFYVAKEGAITMTSRLSHKRSTVSRLIVGNEVKMFWDRFKIIFSSTREELWHGLMTGMQKYHEILKDRKKLNDEVLELRQQNTELKYLLSMYQQDVKKKMKPPCAMQREIPIKPISL